MSTAAEADLLATLAAEEREALLADLTDEEMLALAYDWSFWRRPAQVMPVRDDLVTWLLTGGRGSGKTRPGAETVREKVRTGEWGRIALIGPTAADVRDVMIEGESGLLAVHPRSERPDYEPSKRRVTWPNGAMGFAFSAEEPDRLRGPQHHGAWCDEVGAWKKGPTAWDMMMFGLRLGENPQVVATTTPKPLRWLRTLMAQETTATTRMSTRENVANLAPTFLRTILARYEGTRLGAQEIDGLMLDDVLGALWTNLCIEDKMRVASVTPLGASIPPPAFNRVVVAVDPPGGTVTECGIISAGRHAVQPDPYKPEATVIGDASMAGTPEEWGKAVVREYRRVKADAVVAEVNFGAEMVRAVVHNVDPSVRFKTVRASESKRARAEPIAVMCEDGRVHLFGHFGGLESELTTWVPPKTLNDEGEDIGSKESPNRLDAFVWAITHLLPAQSPGSAHVPQGSGAAWQPMSPGGGGRGYIQSRSRP